MVFLVPNRLDHRRLPRRAGHVPRPEFPDRNLRVTHRRRLTFLGYLCRSRGVHYPHRRRWAAFRAHSHHALCPRRLTCPQLAGVGLSRQAGG